MAIAAFICLCCSLAVIGTEGILRASKLGRPLPLLSKSITKESFTSISFKRLLIPDNKFLESASIKTDWEVGRDCVIAFSEQTLNDVLEFSTSMNLPELQLAAIMPLQKQSFEARWP